MIYFTDSIVPKKVEQSASEQVELEQILKFVRTVNDDHWVVKLKGVPEPVTMSHSQVLRLNRRMLLDFASDMICTKERHGA